MKHTFHAIIVLLLLSSCTHTIYIPLLPDKVNSPGFEGGNEAKADISVSTNQKISADVAYAPIDHVAIIASYRNFGKDNSDINYSDGQVTRREATDLKGERFDIGAGYFLPFNSNGRFEVFAGYGHGSVTVHDTDELTSPPTANDNNLSMNFDRFFVQVGVGSEGKIFSYMGGVKVGRQTYSITGLTSTNTSFPLIVADGPGFIQPYFDMRVGYKYIKFTMQMGFAYSANSIVPQEGKQTAKDSNTFPAAYISAGAVFYFAPRFFRKERTKVEGVKQ